MYFCRDKGVEGVAVTKIVSEYSHSLFVILKFYVAERVILTIKSINVLNRGAGGVVPFKRQKRLEGLLKIGYD